MNRAGRIAAAAEVQAVGNPYALAINLEGIVATKGTAAKPAGKVKISGGGGNVNVAATGTIQFRKVDG